MAASGSTPSFASDPEPSQSVTRNENWSLPRPFPVGRPSTPPRRPQESAENPRRPQETTVDLSLMPPEPLGSAGPPHGSIALRPLTTRRSPVTTRSRYSYQVSAAAAPSPAPSGEFSPYTHPPPPLGQFDDVSMTSGSSSGQVVERSGSVLRDGRLEHTPVSPLRTPATIVARRERPFYTSALPPPPLSPRRPIMGRVNSPPLDIPGGERRVSHDQSVESPSSSLDLTLRAPGERSRLNSNRSSHHSSAASLDFFNLSSGGPDPNSDNSPNPFYRGNRSGSVPLVEPEPRPVSRGLDDADGHSISSFYSCDPPVDPKVE